MRIAILLFFGTTFGFTPLKSLSQEVVHFRSNEILTVDAVFEQIEAQTSYRFIYPSDIFKEFPEVEVKKGSIKVEELLKDCFSGNPVNFEIGTKNSILLSKIPKDISNSSRQQDIEITGTVTDENGVPIPGVNITVEGTTRGASTDFDGNYTIRAESGQVLKFSSVGFGDIMITVGNNPTIDVAMEASASTLGEVVVNALGFRKDADQLGSSSSNIDEDQIVKSMENTLIDGLSGKASGLLISRSSGDPGAGSHIKIRGASTIDGSIQPLIVLDGSPIDNSTETSATGVYEESRLNDINPEDIESINILKGASAAALWGSRASNGVIVITTKKGRNNNKLNISYRTSYTFDKVLKKYPLQDIFGQGDNGVFSQTALRSWGDYIPDRVGGTDIFDESGAYFEATGGNLYYPILEKRSREIYENSNFDQVIGTGHTFTNSLSISGGGEKSKFFVSFNDNDQKGIMKVGSNYRRTSFRANASRDFSRYFKISTNTQYTISSSDRILKGNESGGINIGLLRNPPDFNISDYEGTYYAGDGSAGIFPRQRVFRNSLGEKANPGFNNPLWTINNQHNDTKVNRTIANVEMKSEPTDWLDFTLRAGIDYYVDERTQLLKPGSTGPRNSTGSFMQSKRTRNQINGDFITRLTPELNEDISFELLLGLNLNQRQYSSLTGEFNSFIDPTIELKNFVNGPRSTYQIVNTENKRRNAAAYGSISLGYKDYLFTEITSRYESSSTFGRLSKSGFFFPSVSVAWQFHKNLNIDPAALSFGKFRASFAQVGVEPPLYRTENIFTSAVFTAANGGTLDGSRFGNGAFVPGDRVGNPKLKPEMKTEVEAGLDLRFFRDRLRSSFTFYRNHTKDVLFDVPVARSTGFANIQDNAGEIRNIGYEFDLNYDLLSSKDFTWNLGVVWSKNDNKITKLPDTESLSLGGLSGISGRAVEGYALGVIWGSKFQRNDDNSLALDDNGFPKVSTVEGVIGDPNPNWIGSLTSTVRFKNLEFNVVVRHSQGNDIAAGTHGVLLDYGKDAETANITEASQDLRKIDGSIIPQGTSFRGNIGDFGGGPVALEEQWYRSLGGFFNGATEQFIQDGSNTRIQQVSLAYTWNSKKFRELTKLQSVRLSFVGRNLYVWSKFKGNDPETNLLGASTATGLDYFNTPGTRSFGFTLNVTF